MKKNTEISERILQLIDYLEVTKNEFAKALKYNRSQSIYDIVNGKSAPSYDFFNRFYNSEYSEAISSLWLFTGNGSMFKPKIKPIEFLEEPKEIYDKVNYIPLLPINAIAGFGSGDWSISEQDIQERYVVPEFNGIDFMIRVKGSSMYPKYNSGDVIACRKLSDTQFIQWNKVYVISTREQGILVKRLDQSKHKNCLLAISDNEKYKAFDIPKDEVTGIALVIGVIRLE